MKPPHHQTKRELKGFTLVEMSLVLFLLVALMSTGLYFSTAVNDWKAGRTASETLRSVYVAQRTYLADHPTTPVSSLTENLLRPYLPNTPSTFPKIQGLDGVVRSIKVTVSPPVIINGSGGTYDPSGKPKDSLWDVGE
jgi:prepilin-type N-terminal cleavage/methylation domain-containing protein